MSLMLRKKCQTLLDNVGLDMYHVQVQDANKYLQIVGECGKPLCSIEGIRLSRAAPNAAEIELALELFDAFLAKHAGTFKSFIAAKARADQAVIPESVDNLPSCVVQKHAYQDHWELEFHPLNMPAGAIVTAKSNGKISMSAYSCDINDIDDDFDTFGYGLRSIELSAVDGWLKACKEYNEATREKKKLLSQLNSCEI